MDITLDDVIDAIEKNGLTKIKGSYLNYDVDASFINRHRTPVAGCAIGQAAINLNTDPVTLSIALSHASVTFRETIIHLNDYSDLSLFQIATVLREKYNQEFRKQRVTLV